MPVIERRLSHPHCQKNVDCAMVVMTAASCVHVYVYIKHASLCVYHFPANECILPEAIGVNEHPQRARTQKKRVCPEQKLFFTWCSTPTSEVHPNEVLQRLHQWLLGSSTVQPLSLAPSPRYDGRRSQQSWTGLVVISRAAAIF
jgi:hypothetical protein